MFTASWTALVLIGLAAVLVPTADDPIVVHGVGLVIAVASGYFLFRSFGWSTIDVDSDRVVIRGVLNTWHSAIPDIDRFILLPVAIDYTEPGTALAVRMRSGQVKMFPEFVSRTDAPGFSAEHLARQLNQSIGASAPAG